MTDRDLIETRCQAFALSIDSWTKDDDGDKALLGRWEAVEDDDGGMYEAGDVGVLSACVVGAEKYGNRRVMFGFTPDGTDGAEEVDDPLSMFDPAF